MQTIIRKGNSNDFSQVLELINELAVYEKQPEAVKTTESSMTYDSDLFGFYVAELNNQIIGTAIYFPYYSTWEGRCLYLEDIVVTQSHRRNGIGKLLFNEVVKEAKEFNAKRLMWQVLDWNEPAIEFYKKINSQFDGEWLNCKLTEQQLKNYSEQ